MQSQLIEKSLELKHRNVVYLSVEILSKKKSKQVKSKKKP